MRRQTNVPNLEPSEKPKPTAILYLSPEEHASVGPLLTFGVEVLELEAVRPHLPDVEAAQREMTLAALHFLSQVPIAELRPHADRLDIIPRTNPPKARLVVLATSTAIAVEAVKVPPSEGVELARAFGVELKRKAHGANGGGP